MMQRERERERDRDPYDNVLAIDKANRERNEQGQVVIRAEDTPWQQTRHATLKAFMVPSKLSGIPPVTGVDDWIVTLQEVKTRTGRHRHQGGVVIYVLEGRGHSIIEGQRLDWEPGDLIVLPLLPDGVDHQHFNDGGADAPAQLVGFSNILLRDWVAGIPTTLADHPDFSLESQGRRTEKDLHALLDEAGDAAARRAAQGRVVIRDEDTPWRQNRQALIKRFLLTARSYGVTNDTALDDWRVFEQLIKKHSGRHSHQGGLVIYCIEGEGTSVLEDQHLEWEAGDLICLPLHPTGGYQHQHFNRDDNYPARWVAFNQTSTRIWSASQIIQFANHPDFKEED